VGCSATATGEANSPSPLPRLPNVRAAIDRGQSETKKNKANNRQQTTNKDSEAWYRQAHLHDQVQHILVKQRVANQAMKR